MGLDQNSQRALDVYRKAVKAKKTGKLPAGFQANIAPIRVRLEKDVDRSKAGPSCKRCLGTGLLGVKLIPGNRGCEPNRIPIICRCVARNGGVKPDKLDSLLADQLPEPKAG